MSGPSPDPRVRPLVALVQDEAHRQGRDWTSLAIHGAVVRLLLEGHSAAAVLTAATRAARDPHGPAQPHDVVVPPDAPAGVATDPPCEVCGLSEHACTRMATRLHPDHAHPYTPRRRPATAP